MADCSRERGPDCSHEHQAAERVRQGLGFALLLQLPAFSPVTKVRTFIPHDVVFPGEPSTFEAFRNLLRTLSRTDTLIWCARFNLTLDNRGHHDDHFIQNSAARAFLGDEHLARINAWAKREGRTATDTGMFFRAQVVELMCWVALLCDEHEDDGATFERDATRIAFVRAALLATEAWSASVYDDRFESTGSPIDDRIRAAAVLRRGVALSASRGAHLEAVARSASIFGPRLRARCPEFERLFREATSLGFDEYLALASTLSMLYAVDCPHVLDSNSAIFSSERIGDHLQAVAREKVPAFLQMFSQTPDELAIALHSDDPNGALRWGVKRTHRAIRDRPLLRLARGRVIVMDAGMMREAVSMGPLFSALKTAPRPFVNTLFGVFGDAVEAYVQQLLHGMYPSRAPLVSRLRVNPSFVSAKGSTELCDVLLQGARSAALFEIKAVFIRDEDVVSDDPAVFPSAVKKQYASPVAKGGRAKGVNQLARAVKSLASGEARIEGVDAGTTLYPVLVALDDLISAPGTLDILHKAFAEAVGVNGADFPSAVGTMRVARLTVMTVSDVELLDRVVQKTELLNILHAYTTERGLQSFHDHLAAHQSEYGLAIHGLQTTAIAEAAMDRFKEFLFGTTKGRAKPRR